MSSDSIRRLLLIDYFAAALGGCRINKTFNAALESVVFDMGGKPESHVMFHDVKIPAPLAALMNGVYCHGADMDDGHKESWGHPACATIPAVLALAISVAGRPENHFPKSADNAKFSNAYAACCMLANGSFGLDDLEKAPNCGETIRR